VNHDSDRAELLHQTADQLIAVIPRDLEQLRVKVVTGASSFTADVFQESVIAVTVAEWQLHGRALAGAECDRDCHLEILARQDGKWARAPNALPKSRPWP
jgi:hypothetical protein